MLGAVPGMGPSTTPRLRLLPPGSDWTLPAGNPLKMTGSFKDSDVIERTWFDEREHRSSGRSGSGAITVSKQRTERRMSSTGIADLDLGFCVHGRHADIHVLGVLHKQPLTIARVTGAITRYEPDLVAIECSEEAILLHHPDAYGSKWPPEDELGAAAYIVERQPELLIAGISTRDFEVPARFQQLDAEIFVELGLLEAEGQLTLDTYYELDLPTIRQWCEMTEQREPDLYEEVVASRDRMMAGHLHFLSERKRIDTIVAAIGVQHLTGVIDLLSSPWEIPEEDVALPPVADYQIS